MKRILITSLFLLVLSASAWGYDDLTELSDEFDSPESLADWRRIYQTEGWGNDALEQIDINTSRPGRMFMLPHTSSWYEEWRGELTYKLVTGDFVITTEVEPRSRSGNGAPQSLYSLAGIMVRTPRSMTQPADWEPGLQNYVFLSLGAASDPGQFQFEVKTTENSQSTLHITPGVPRAEIQVARIGAHLIMLRRNEGGVWAVHRRYSRADMPATLQAGLTVYTDWNICEQVGFSFQNSNVLTNGTPLPGGQFLSGCQPDLAASFEFVRYQRPTIPAALAGADFSNPSAVTDEALLSFLGENAKTPGGAATAPGLTAGPLHDNRVTLSISTEVERSYRVQASTNLNQWTTLTNFISTGESFTFSDSTAGAGHLFYQAVTP